MVALCTPVMSDTRFWLWVDGVGGYLVCEADAVVIGQPVHDASVDIPILADLSRRHAVIRRQGEAYLLEALRAVKLNGRAVEHPAPLGLDCQIELGEGVRLRFRQPHPWSLSARVDVVSRHRTQPSSSGVLLAHDTLVLSPRPESHVVCPNWTSEVVLFRQAEQWHCRARVVELQVDGRSVSGGAPLTRQSRVVGPDFSISLEPVSNFRPPATK